MTVSASGSGQALARWAAARGAHLALIAVTTRRAHRCSLRLALNFRENGTRCVDAEEALIAALKVKMESPEALIAPAK